ncbi:MAG TPA: hypothetical protein PK002_13335, partial [Cellvibrio sp.]|nr:hypothetical protein [Cellvibrio sp.]
MNYFFPREREWLNSKQATALSELLPAFQGGGWEGVPLKNKNAALALTNAAFRYTQMTKLLTYIR